MWDVACEQLVRKRAGHMAGPAFIRVSLRGSNLGNIKIRRSHAKDRQHSRDFWPASDEQENSLN